ncbi:MAG: stage II sporulation protein M [Candidatus Kapaibacterium sp.]|nr:stage II sporulation protein M [Bacteroidota bacterium]
MREVTFLKQNAEKWKRFEGLISDKFVKPNPNELTDLFVELTDDLSYAQTYYPESKSTKYLNTLAARVHQSIYKNKKEDSSRLVTFWTREIPLVIRSAHKEILISFIIFLLSVFVGALSMNKDDRYVRSILGDGYVNMTEENIKNKDPFGVYKQEEGYEMFVRIAYNNVRVGITFFLSGLFFGLGPIYLIFKNGIMLGVFHYLFYKHGLLGQSLAVIWIHGTIEMSTMIVAGGTGFVLAKSFLMPQTFSRITSFINGAKASMKIMISLIPLIVFAAVLESWVTRFTDMPFFLNMLIVFGSLAFILWYYVAYPILLERRISNSRGQL